MGEVRGGEGAGGGLVELEDDVVAVVDESRLWWSAVPSPLESVFSATRRLEGVVGVRRRLARRLAGVVRGVVRVGRGVAESRLR